MCGAASRAEKETDGTAPVVISFRRQFCEPDVLEGEIAQEVFGFFKRSSVSIFPCFSFFHLFSDAQQLF
jgi:hypothetical protein